MGLGEAVDLAGALDLLPTDLRILGIEGVDFDNGVGLSTDVDAGVDAAVEFLSLALRDALA